MMHGVHILGSRLISQRTELNVIADNVANINTHGFKRLSYGYEEVAGKTNGQHVGDYTKGIGVLVDYSPGTLESTGNPLDVALEGDAFFTVDVNGQTQYTRNGHFLMRADGTLVNGLGNPVLDSGGAEIILPLEAENISITGEGAVATEEGVVAELGIFKFSKEDARTLNRSGTGGFFAPAEATAERANEEVTVLQGRLEVSNVSGIDEIVKMQELSKSYQQAMKMMKNMEDLEERAIRNLSAQTN